MEYKMKFDKLYKLIVNEADELTDQADLAEVSATPDVTPSVSNDPATMSDEEKVEYLMKNSLILNKNKDKTETEKRAQASYMVKNGFFDAMLGGMADREAVRKSIKTELAGDEEVGGGETIDDVEGLEELPSDLAADVPETSDIEDIGGGLSTYRRQKKEELEDEEEIPSDQE